jgi:ATP-dependent Lhr-like helicase
VCSTSLELGIDIGFIDLVIMLGSPKASSRALQRIGRAGHKLHDIAKGRFIITDRDDMVECAVIQKEMIEKKIDRIYFPRNCLDILSQQIYGMAIYKTWDIDELFNLIRKSYSYSTLSKNDFFDIISYLSGEYNLEKNNVYGKIWYDKETKQIGKRGKLARVIYMTNIGTIPEESFITVKIAPEGEKIGVIDEGFMERMKKGDVFVLGGSKYIYLYSKGMNIYVKPAINRNPTIPSWFSEMLPLSFDSANEINKFRMLMNDRFQNKQKKQEIIKFVEEYLYTSESIATSITDYFNEQYKFSEIPHSKLMIIEKYKGEKNYLLVQSMYGRRVNDALSRALGFIMGHLGGRDIEIGISDSGFYFAGEKMPIEKAIEALTEENLHKILVEAIEKTDILTRRFRHCAARSLMILRSYKGQNKSVGKQQMKSHFLMAAVRKVSKNFPILNEARREVLEDLMDIASTKLIVKQIKLGELKIKIKEAHLPSPFGLNLILQGHTDLIKIEDKQAFLKRMHELHMKAIEGGAN